MSAAGPEEAAGEEQAPRAASAPGRRTHPITPLLTGWRVIAGIVAVVTAQNLVSLLNEVTVMRVLIAVGVIAGAAVLGIALSALGWWFTTYAIDEEGVLLQSGILSRSRRFAPRERIESVSVQRPLLARLAGLAKVRIEMAGGAESHLDVEYVTSAEADRIRRRILETIGQGPEDARGNDDTSAGEQSSGASGAVAVSGDPAGHDLSGAIRSALHDGVTDGELIAEIPTSRLLLSLVRDLGNWATLVFGLLGVTFAIITSVMNDGISIPAVIAMIPMVLAIPKIVLGRIESGWGFVSRNTERGLRMRHGLLNTRTDNIAAGRLQSIRIERPLLWRGPGWTRVTAVLAGTEGEEEDDSVTVLPVGTAEELRRTLGHLMAPLGAPDDQAAIEHLLTARARDIDGLRPRSRWFWIARRTHATVLLPGALVQRRGMLARSLELIPRERIQEVELSDGPLLRRLGALDLEIAVANDGEIIRGLSEADAAGLWAVLAHDAAARRRLRDRAQWPRPLLAASAAPVGPAAGEPAPVELAAGGPASAVPAAGEPAPDELAPGEAEGQTR